MSSFRKRRATILPSTLTFALLCQSGLVCAQSPEGWPFEDKALNPTAPSSQPAAPPATQTPAPQVTAPPLQPAPAQATGQPASEAAGPFAPSQAVPFAPTAAAPAAKTPVQLKLEQLYKRDGRPLPEYMQNDAFANDNSQPASRLQRPSPNTSYPARQPAASVSAQPAPYASVQPAPYAQAQPAPYAQAQPAPYASTQQAPYAPSQPARYALTQPAPYVQTQQPAPYSSVQQAPYAQTQQAPYASTQSAPYVPARLTQEAPPIQSQGTIRQELSDYYAAQGKPMPGTQPTWSSAEAPQQQVPAYAGQTSQSGSAEAAPAQPRLIDRINPFRLWHKEQSTPAPVTPASSYGNATTQTTSSPNAGGYWTQTAPVPAAAPAPFKQPVVEVPAKPSPKTMTVEFGPSAPISLVPVEPSTAPRPRQMYLQPAVASNASPASAPPASAKTSTSVPPAAAVAAKSPTAQPRPVAAAAPTATRKVADARSERTPFDLKAETEADRKSAGNTRVALQETDSASAPEPAKVTTANVTETNDHSPAPSAPVAHAERPKQSTETAAPSPPASRPVTQYRHQESPVAPAPHATAATAPPKSFEERQTAKELPHRPEQTTAKMHKIGERVGQRGLKGFCPVALREQRELVNALPIYSSVFDSRRYYFSSAEAKERFDGDPQKYAPIAGGVDVVVKTTSDQSIDGTLDFAAWYKDRLFLFSSPESLEAFSLNPLPYAGVYLKSH